MIGREAPRAATALTSATNRVSLHACFDDIRKLARRPDLTRRLALTEGFGYDLGHCACVSATRRREAAWVMRLSRREEEMHWFPQGAGEVAWGTGLISVLSR